MAEQSNSVPPSLTSNHASQRPIRVVVVGAGGTGGRCIPGLMQILKRGDSVAIVDGDHVEDRNLMRQNFRARDIGENKAEVMARRYRRDGITMDAHATMLTPEIGEQLMRPPVGADSTVPVVILGCVDNWKARVTMDKLMNAGNQRMWIDAGNERRGGQVLLSAKGWPFSVKDHATGKGGDYGWSVPGLRTAMPQLLEPKPWHCFRCDVENPGKAEMCAKCKQPEASCGDRIDLQTVAVNQMSATAILNALSLVLYKVPFSTCGAFFSTLNTMTPIPLAKVDFSRYVVQPEDTYACSLNED